ncbi:MAG: hypothetical protein ACOCZ8_03070 [Bacteroidota bacterium]
MLMSCVEPPPPHFDMRFTNAAETPVVFGATPDTAAPGLWVQALEMTNFQVIADTAYPQFISNAHTFQVLSDSSLLGEDGVPHSRFELLLYQRDVAGAALDTHRIAFAGSTFFLPGRDDDECCPTPGRYGWQVTESFSSLPAVELPPPGNYDPFNDHTFEFREYWIESE